MEKAWKTGHSLVTVTRKQRPRNKQLTENKIDSGGRACKPDSVPRTNRKPACARGDHSSSPGIATGIQQPTRGFSIYDGLRLLRRSAFIFMNADSVTLAAPPP